MATTNSAFVTLTSPNLVGSTVQAAGAVVALNASNANQIVNGGTGTRLDKVVTDLATAGYPKNGCAYLTLTGTTAITLDLTALAAATGVVVAGDTTFATWNQLVFVNTGTQDLVLSPGSSNPARLQLGGTSPTLTIAAGSTFTLQSVAGLGVDSSHRTLTITPTAGGSIGVCVGGS